MLTTQATPQPLPLEKGPITLKRSEAGTNTNINEETLTLFPEARKNN